MMHRRTILLAAIGAASFWAGGCSSYPEVAAAVDPPKAREALKTTLEAWKAGKKPEELTTGSPAIVAQDFDWMAGKQLVSYELQGDGTPQDANLRVEVELNLSDAAGAASKKKVAYIVGTSPKLTVFRAFE